MYQPSVNHPNYRCMAYQSQYDDWKVVNDVYTGTRHMREMSTEYLPREPAESYRAYSIRRAKAILYNAVRQTVKGATGMVFKRSPDESNDIPPQIREDMKNIDLAGTQFNDFCKNVFEAAFRDGHCYILVEYQKKNDNVISRLDEEKTGRRPWWVMLTKDKVINWRTKEVNGETMLSQVTIEQDVLIDDGKFGEKRQKQWLVLYPGYWEMYNQNPISTNISEATPPIIDFGTTSLPFIPLIPVYTNQTGYFTSEPILLELAYLNIRHYQVYSDYSHILHVVNVPILWFIGRQRKNQQEVGANAAVDLDEGGAMGYAEHAGSAIGGTRTEIRDLEERMNIFGLMMTAPRETKAAATATERVITKGNQTSVLSAMAGSIKQGLELALRVHAMYRGLASGGTVNVTKDLDKLTLSPQMFQLYLQMVKEYVLDVETLWLIMQQADLLPDGFDSVKAMKNILQARSEAEQRLKDRLNMKGGTMADKNPDSNPNDKKPPNPRTGPESFGQGAGAS